MNAHRASAEVRPTAPAVIAFSAYSRVAASTRVRLYDWFDHLGIAPRSECYAGLRDASPRELLGNAGRVLAAERALRRIDVSGCRVVMSRAASPLSRGALEERLLRSAAHSTFDFDDAIHLATSIRRRVFGVAGKFAACARAATTVVAGNDHLADVAGRYSSSVVVIPSCVEPSHYVPRTDWALPDRPTAVWLGSPATEHFLLPVLPALARLQARTGLRLTVISSGRPNPRFGEHHWITYRPWSQATFAADLATADLALAPLDDTPYARGKCAYKLLQYAASGLPMAGSPVGANRQALDRFGGTIVEDDWYGALSAMLEATESDRAHLAREALRAVREHYSFEAWAGAWTAATDLA